MKRHKRWVPVEPGTVIPAGQPYRRELHGARYINAMENTSGDRAVPVGGNAEWFVDSTWRPPLVLPTEPTWGIVVYPRKSESRSADIGCWQLDAAGQLMRTNRVLDGRFDTIKRDFVADFIPLTPEQTARIEAAR
jgi:hypothetical protein